MCDCQAGFVKLSTFAEPDLMPPHEPENSKCYEAYTSAYYARLTAYHNALDGIRDPGCAECVNETLAVALWLTMMQEMAEYEVAYWKCRASQDA